MSDIERKLTSEISEETAGTVAEEVIDDAADEAEDDTPKGSKGRDLLYKVVTKRDESVLRAFITFNYRVIHPKVLLRSVLYAIVFFSFGYVSGFNTFGIICFVISFGLLFVALFRTNISLMMTTRDDEDYKNGTVYEYNFYQNGAEMMREGVRVAPAKNYKKSITAVFVDQSFYYLSTVAGDLFILPKDRFTVGDAETFESFILDKTGLERRWIPTGIKGFLNRFKAFSTQPMIDTEGWKDLARRGKEKASAGKAEKVKAEAPPEPAKTVKPKTLKKKTSDKDE